jgi:hypothetical protein
MKSKLKISGTLGPSLDTIGKPRSLGYDEDDFINFRPKV